MTNHNWNIDEALKFIEQRFSVPGTTITRVMMDNNLLGKHGIHPQNTGREATMIWCLSVGILLEPKTHFYGITIRETVEKALDALRR